MPWSNNGTLSLSLHTYASRTVKITGWVCSHDGGNCGSSPSGDTNVHEFDLPPKPDQP